MRNFATGFLLSSQDMAWFGEAYASDPADYRAAPLPHSQHAMPPSVVMTATLDPLHGQGIAYVEALKAAGVPVKHVEAEGNIHGLIHLRNAIPSAQDDVTRNLDALKAVLAEAMAPA